jgi:hypothetical protein
MGNDVPYGPPRFSQWKGDRQEFDMPTYVILGPKGNDCADCLMLMPKRCAKSALAREVNFEIKKEFKSPSGNVARIVYELYQGENGHFHNQSIDEFIEQLAKYFGYEIKKASVPRKKHKM